MSWWDTIKSRFGAESGHMLYIPIAPEHDDGARQAAALEPYESYFRIWLDDLFLAKAVSWGVEQFPAVHSEVRVSFAGSDARAFSTLARPPEDELGPGARLSYKLTELMPYNGGTVEIEASLLALPGADQLGPAIDVLTKVGDVVGPPLGQALKLADTLAGGLRDFLAGQGHARLGLHETLVSGDEGPGVMRAGSLAVIVPDPKHPLAPDDLRVRNRQLHVIEAGGEVKPLTGSNYMLMRVEGRDERDDWRLPDIDGPLKRALMQLENGNATAAAGYRAVALAATYESPDIAEHDRRRVIDRIKREYADAQTPKHGAVGRERPDLTTAMRRSISRAQARAEGPVEEDELFV